MTMIFEVRTIRTLWITRKDAEDYPPELIEAWDAFSIDENHEGWTAACDKALASICGDLAEFRYVDIDLPAVAINQAFQPPRIEPARIT